MPFWEEAATFGAGDLGTTEKDRKNLLHDEGLAICAFCEKSLQKLPKKIQESVLRSPKRASGKVNRGGSELKASKVHLA
jgi:hypothetical protein